MVGARKMLQSGQRFISSTVSGTSYLPLSGKTCTEPRASMAKFHRPEPWLIGAACTIEPPGGGRSTSAK